MGSGHWAVECGLWWASLMKLTRRSRQLLSAAADLCGIRARMMHFTSTSRYLQLSAITPRAASCISHSTLQSLCSIQHRHHHTPYRGLLLTPSNAPDCTFFSSAADCLPSTSSFPSQFPQ